MKFSTLAVLAGVLTISAVGCGSAGSGSCTVATTGANASMACSEYGTTYNASSVMSACTTTGSGATATYSSSGCSSTNRVGRCTIGTGGATITTSYYSPLAASDVMTLCTAASGTYAAN